MSDVAEIDYLIELRGVYDGWSIAVYTDGTIKNRWADDDGNAYPGYERRWLAAEDAIGAMRATPSRDESPETGAGEDQRT